MADAFSFFYINLGSIFGENHRIINRFSILFKIDLSIDKNCHM